MRDRSIRPFLKAIAAMAVIAALSGVQSAQALDQELQINVDGFTTTFAVGNGGSASTGGDLSFHGVVINSTISDNFAGSAGGSFLQGSTTTLRDADGAAHTVTVSVGETNWLAPTTPPSITALSSLTGNTTFAGASNLSYQSYVDQANGQNSTPAIYTTGLQNTYALGNVGSPGSWGLKDASTLISSLHSLFSMTSVFSVNLSDSAVVNLSSQVKLTSVPEPSSMAITGLGALGMIGYGLRRRKARGA